KARWTTSMRISDDRYRRERWALELALRFLRHEARTQTIRAWTGLSDDRIRKLYRSYMSHARRYLPRHRGKSPHQIAYFTRSLRMQEETAVLASVLSLLGVVPASAGAATPVAVPGLGRGELLCQAFEAYRLLLPTGPPPRIAFLGHDAPLVRGAGDDGLVLLGWFRGARCLLVDLRAGDAADPPAGTSFEELRPLAPLLGTEESGLLAYARALSIWRARHRHCGVCGAPTIATRAGHILSCTNTACAQELFPRLDPAIIVLVSDGERALLGRQPSW